MPKQQAEIGIIGGSGFYNLAANLKEVKITTPYGTPSDKLAIGKIGNKKVAFLARHSKEHNLPPHLINYRANICAFHSLGVKQIITATACGSLQANIKPGDFVVLDQFIDRTRNRKDTFFDGPITTHISSAEPYCSLLRKLSYKAGKKLGIRIHPSGTIVVINGPRFSTTAESEWFTKMGWDVVNMTQYPEVVLAKELAMCYCALALVTDWDAGIVFSKKMKPVSSAAIIKVFNRNISLVKKLMLEMLKNWPKKRTCACADSLKGAVLG